MAAQTTPINGSLSRVSISTDGGTSYKMVAYETTSSLSLSSNDIEIASKQVCGWTERQGGKKSWTISGTALYQNGLTAQLSYKDIFPLVGTKVDVKIDVVDCATGTPIADEYQYDGEAIVGSADPTFPDNDNSSYSFELRGTGALTQSVIV